MTNIQDGQMCVNIINNNNKNEFIQLATTLSTSWIIAHETIREFKENGAP